MKLWTVQFFCHFVLFNFQMLFYKFILVLEALIKSW